MVTALLLSVCLCVSGITEGAVAARRPDPRKPPRAERFSLADALAGVPAQRYPYPGRRANGDPWLEALREGAVEFWRTRGVDAGGASVDVADDLLHPGAVGLGRKDGREAILDGKVAGTYLANARNEDFTVRGRRRNLHRLGELIAHEVGHAAGLEHTEGGLMSAQSVLGELNPLGSLVRELIPRNPVPNPRERSAARARAQRRAAGVRGVEG